jgi:polysaccharide pyruvyl transferase WcaK-like protein
MKNKKLLICGSYGAKNIGDELILLGIKKLFEGNDIKVLSESNEKNHFPKFPAGINSLFNFLKNRNNLKALKDCDYFILGGGNLFGGPSKRANYIWAIQALFAIAYKKPIIMFCQSIGDNHDYIIKKIIKYIFSKAYKIYLRDTGI